MSKIIHLRWLTLPLQFFAQVNLRAVGRALLTQAPLGPNIG